MSNGAASHDYRYCFLLYPILQASTTRAFSYAINTGRADGFEILFDSGLFVFFWKRDGKDTPHRLLPYIFLNSIHFEHGKTCGRRLFSAMRAVSTLSRSDRVSYSLYLPTYLPIHGILSATTTTTLLYLPTAPPLNYYYPNLYTLFYSNIPLQSINRSINQSIKSNQFIQSNQSFQFNPIQSNHGSME